jgi:alkanesulfonate monooxygenase SsuD/methylene tetrahydromethanopterin reductase-like flavin-dependent oxidoreductase (luciferase family)
MTSEVLFERIWIRVTIDSTTADHPGANRPTATASHTATIERTSSGAIALGTGTAALAEVTS